VYGFAKQSGGQVQITSEPGLGTTVCLFLPRNEDRLPSDPAPAHATEAGRLEQRGNVLVVDDETAICTLVAELLHEQGLQVLTAGTGAQALQALHGLPPGQRIDLLVTDVGLPGGMNGRQLADALRQSHPRLKVLFITGYAESAVLVPGQLDADMHVMTKPFEMDALARKVAELLEAA
jgi:CheY-like chemotaxis protein